MNSGIHGRWALVTVLHLLTIAAAPAQTTAPAETPGSPALQTRAARADEILIDALPYAIEKPGKYLLAKNLDTDASGIAIKSKDVVLDLNGHTLTYGGGGENKDVEVITYNGIQKGNVGRAGIVCPTDIRQNKDFAFNWNNRFTGVVIRNGRVVDGQGKGLAYSNALDINGLKGAVLENLIIEVSSPDSFAIKSGPETTIRHCTIAHKGTIVSNRHQMVAAVQLGPGSEISQCVIDPSPQTGIKAMSGSIIHDNLIRLRTTVTNGYGVTGYGQKDIQVFNNRIVNHNGRGIHLSEKSAGWDVHDNYIEVRETANREYPETMAAHGIKLERTRDSRIYRNTVVSVSTATGYPTALNADTAAGANNRVTGNVFVALTTHKQPASSLFTVQADGTGNIIENNSFLTNDYAVTISPDGGANLTLRRCTFGKINPTDKVTFIRFRNYMKAQGTGHRFIDCLFQDGIDPRSYDFPSKDADWANDGDYAVGNSLALLVMDGGKPVAGAKVTCTDKAGGVTVATSGADGKVVVDLLTFQVIYRKDSKSPKIVELAPYELKVEAAGKAMEFTADASGPSQAQVHLDKKDKPTIERLEPATGAEAGLNRESAYFRQRLKELTATTRP